MIRVVIAAVAMLGALVGAGAQTTPVPPALPGQAPEPPPIPQPQIQFYFNDNGTPSGPVSFGEIRAKVEAGKIGPDTLVWKTGLPSWVAAKDLPEVAVLLPPAFDPGTYFVGTWELQAPGPTGTTGPAKMTIKAAPGGTLTGSYSFVIAAYNATATLPITGTWKAQVSGDRRFTLTLNLELQIQGQVKQVSTVSRVEVVDDNTLRDEADGTISKRISR